MMRRRETINDKTHGKLTSIGVINNQQLGCISGVMSCAEVKCTTGSQQVEMWVLFGCWLCRFPPSWGGFVVAVCYYLLSELVKKRAVASLITFDIHYLFICKVKMKLSSERY
jgi:hypothetical protein